MDTVFIILILVNGIIVLLMATDHYLGMDIVYILIAGIIVLLIVAAPFVPLYFLHKWLIKRGCGTVGRTLIVAYPLFVIFIIYTAIYPLDSFYLDEFEVVTSRKAPVSATIIRKDASYPDMHGDYCSASLMAVSENDYAALLTDLANDKRLNLNEFVGSAQLRNVMGNVQNDKIIFRWGDTYSFIGFLDDKKTIVVHRCSS